MIAERQDFVTVYDPQYLIKQLQGHHSHSKPKCSITKTNPDMQSDGPGSKAVGHMRAPLWEVVRQADGRVLYWMYRLWD